jgi:thioredoxin reductase (NADPH)
VHTTNAGKSTRVTFDRAIIATGGRPAVLPLPGWQLAITSDDLFWRKQSPGKTLVIGGGYIALECAGFMHHLGLDTTVMVRGDVLRGMDQQAANQVRTGVETLSPQRNTVQPRSRANGYM